MGGRKTKLSKTIKERLLDCNWMAFKSEKRKIRLDSFIGGFREFVHVNNNFLWVRVVLVIIVVCPEWELLNLQTESAAIGAQYWSCWVGEENDAFGNEFTRYNWGASSFGHPLRSSISTAWKKDTVHYIVINISRKCVCEFWALIQNTPTLAQRTIFIMRRWRWMSC